MPYTAKTVPDYVPAGKAKKWSEIWNSAYEYAKGQKKSDEDAEKYAFAVANSKALEEGKSGVNDMEREYRVSSELRASGGAGDADPLALEGYAAKWNTYSQDLGGFKERIKPGAFGRALKENQDIRALMNHDPNHVLGRTKNGTLTLNEDSTGLKFRVELPNTQIARDLHTSVSRGDIDQCSFAFKVPTGGDNWGEDKDENGVYFASRELQDVDLFDVSAVTYPAYLDTNVSARAVPAEIRSAIDKRNSEKREASLEEQISCVNAALQQKFGMTPGGWAKYQTVETYGDSAIVSCWDGSDNAYYRIAYTMDSDGSVTLGDMQSVEKTWTPSTERGAARLEKLRLAHKNALDPDGDGDDDSSLLDCLSDAVDVCDAASAAAKKATKSLNKDLLVDFVTASQEAIASLTDAVSEATAELAEGENSLPPNAEPRAGQPDPAAGGNKMEGVSMDPKKPSAKVQLAESSAKLASAHAALKAAKVAHAKAKEEVAGATDDQKAEAQAKAAAAQAVVKTAKAAHMKAAEEHQQLKASFDISSGGAGEKPDDGFDPDVEECMCRHCATGLVDRDDSEDDWDDDCDCTDPSCPCQNRWSVSGDDGMMRCGQTPEEKEARRERRAEEIRWDDPEYYEKRTDKVRTKRVGGKDLTADKFAFVGDPDRTETWKLPIHDAGHVRNALARFGQTQGIPANKKAGVWRKIKAAAAKFGIEVSKEQNSVALAGVPVDEQERLQMRARIGFVD